MHDRALRLDGVAAARPRSTSGPRPSRAPLDVDVADRRAAATTSAAAEVRAAHEHLDGCGFAARQRQAAVLQILRQKCSRQMASHVWIPFDCHPTPVMERAMKLLPGQALSSSGRPRLDYSGGGDVGLSVHVEQRRAGRAERDGHLVHRPPVPGRHRGHRRGVLADSGLRAAVRRRRLVGADIGGAGLRRAPLCARIAGDLDRPVGLAVHGAPVRLA